MTDEADEAESELAAICAIDHFDWLAAITALAEGGPGTAASAADLAGVRARLRPGGPRRPGRRRGPARRRTSPTDEDDGFYLSDDDEFDDLTMEGLFLPVTSLWQVLGAIDDDERLTALGWWGLPEAMLRVWAPSARPAPSATAIG